MSFTLRAYAAYDQGRNASRERKDAMGTWLGLSFQAWKDKAVVDPHSMMGVELPALWLHLGPQKPEQARSVWMSRCRLSAADVAAQIARNVSRERKDAMSMSIDQAPRLDYDSSSTESITLEQNSKGVNVKVRCIRQEGQTDAEWVARIAQVYREAQYAVGNR